MIAFLALLISMMIVASAWTLWKYRRDAVLSVLLAIVLTVVTKINSHRR